MHGGEILSIDINGDYIASGGRDRKVVVKVLGNESWTKIISHHTDDVTQVRFMGGEGPTKDLLFTKGRIKWRCMVTKMAK